MIVYDEYSDRTNDLTTAVKTLRLVIGNPVTGVWSAKMRPRIAVAS